MSLRRPLLLIALLSIPAHAAVRLTYPMAGAPTAIYWKPDSFPIRYSIDRKIADAFNGAASVVERSFNAWSAVGDASVSFQNAGIEEGLQPGFDRKNTITAAGDLFRDQGFIAVTTNWYDDRGRMLEADIQIDASLATSAWNIQQTLEHEVGHLLGLDHSAVLTSVMYPYVSKGGSVSLDTDDRIAIATVYPKSDPALGGATLKGRVVGDQGGVFAAQVVAISETGEPVATGLTDASGEFVLQRVPSGAYRLYAEPLDGPVEPGNLSGVWRQAKVAPFRTEFLDGAAIRVENGKVYGNLVVKTSGAPVRLNPRWIGLTADDRPDVSLGAAPVLVRPGQTISLAVAGDGFTSGMTTFEILNPGVRRVSDFRYAANYVYARFEFAAGAPAGSVVIVVRSGNETAALTGALRVDAPPRIRASRG
ncbi:MAG TPA: matrixin family metalloprotease [Thermoanaerobaculia bacterium]|nr:matrixin family metalloprotease [Thermoanaerobaculia bacterium]